VSALGLGEIRLNSALNEPLRAEIPLISVSADEADLLSVRLASNDQFQKAGIEQTADLRLLRFETITGADGKPAIRVTTREAVAEPYLNFLIEVNWPTGRVVREYTVLLDPPVLMRGAPPVSQLPAVTEPAAARPPSVSAPSISPPSGGEYGPVATGETLWMIAQTVRPDSGLTLQQVMLALQQANPDAFIRNNINLLKAGAILRVPSRDEMAALAAEEARASARAQTAEWDAYRGQVASRTTPAPRTETPAAGAPAPAVAEDARLKLVVPEERAEAAPSMAPEGAGVTGGTSELAELRRQLDLASEEAEARRLQNDELNNQIRELEEQVTALEQLIALNVDEMAALQENLKARAEEPDAPATTATEAPATEEPMAAAGEPAAPEAATPAEAQPAAPEAVTEAAAPEPAAAPPPPPAPEPGLLEDPWLLGGAALILLALIGVVVAKRRAAAQAGAETEPAAETAVLFDEAAVDTPSPAAEPAAPSFDPGEATGKDVLREFVPEGLGKPAAAGEDPLEQADVFLAYGRNEQAEELLRNVLTKEPGRLDVMLKLLEIYHANQDRASFERQLEDLHDTLAGEPGPHWNRAVELARTIAPDHHLLAGLTAAGAVAAAGNEEVVAFDQTPGGDELDIELDLDFEPVFGDEDDNEPLDITQEFTSEGLADLTDEGAVEAALDTGDEAEAAADTDLDFDFEPEPETPTPEAEAEPRGFDLDGDDASLERTGELTGEDLAGLDLDFEAGETAPPVATKGGAAEEGGELDFDLETAAEPERPAEPDDLDLDLDLGEALATDDLEELDDTLTGSDDLGGFDFGGDMVGTKLELAQTYLDMDDFEAARAILDEVLAEGDEGQQQQARELLERCPGN
jgi:pilus assembly protein FimV